QRSDRRIDSLPAQYTRDAVNRIRADERNGKGHWHSRRDQVGVSRLHALADAVSHSNEQREARLPGRLSSRRSDQNYHRQNKRHSKQGVISSHYGPLFFFPAALDFGNAGLEEAKNLAWQKGPPDSDPSSAVEF